VLPEILWIGLLHSSLGDARAAAVVVEVVRAAERIPVSPEAESPLHGIAAAWFGGLSNEEQQVILSGLSEATKAQIQDSFRPLILLYPTCPMSFFVMNPSSTDDAAAAVGAVKTALERLLDRRSREATFCQMSGLYALAVNGRLLFPVEAKETVEALQSVEAYPETEESRKAGRSWASYV